MRWTRIVAAVSLPALLLAGCKDDKKQETLQPAFDMTGYARQLVEQNLRALSDSPPAVRIRGVQVYPQAMPRQIAVCGQVDLARGNGGMFTLFVSVVSYEDGSGAKPPGFQVDQTVAETVEAANRVWAKMITYCYENGGPPPPPPPTAASAPQPPATAATEPAATPPAASAATPADSGHAQPPPRRERTATKDPATASPREAPPPPPPPREVPHPPAVTPAREPTPPKVTADTPARAPASGSVVLRQPGNLRAGPSGGGEVIRVVPRDTTLRVFGEAPGGWYQVGDAAPWGWIHSSMVQRQ
ncbi:protein of unknown function [Rhodovastum atsumiense]|nr:protein of unknown function [Rhodovastum atsumiense]